MVRRMAVRQRRRAIITMRIGGRLTGISRRRCRRGLIEAVQFVVEERYTIVIRRYVSDRERSSGVVAMCFLSKSSASACPSPGRARVHCNTALSPLRTPSGLSPRPLQLPPSTAQTRRPHLYTHRSFTLHHLLPLSRLDTHTHLAHRSIVHNTQHKTLLKLYSPQLLQSLKLSVRSCVKSDSSLSWKLACRLLTIA